MKIDNNQLSEDLDRIATELELAEANFDRDPIRHRNRERRKRVEWVPPSGPPRWITITNPKRKYAFLLLDQHNDEEKLIVFAQRELIGLGWDVDSFEILNCFVEGDQVFAKIAVHERKGGGVGQADGSQAGALNTLSSTTG